MKNMGFYILLPVLYLSCDKENIDVSNSIVALDYQIDNISNLELSHAFQESVTYDPLISDLVIPVLSSCRKTLK